MELSDLTIFKTVVEAGGITRAAERLNRVQSNVTTRVRQLEEDLGVELFIREGKRLHLSPAGRQLLDYADRLIELAAEAREALQDTRPRGVFRLGAMESTAAVRLPGPLSTFMKRYPEVNVELRTGNPEQLSRAVLAGELDAALAAEPIAAAHFEQVTAFDEELVIVSAASQSSLKPDQPAAGTMIAFEHGCPHRKRLEEWYERRGETPEQTIQLGSYHAMLGCVVVGMGIALLPKSVLSTFPESRRLAVHSLPRGLNRARTQLFWRKGAGSPSIAALAKILQGSPKTPRRENPAR